MLGVCGMWSSEGDEGSRAFSYQQYRSRPQSNNAGNFYLTKQIRRADLGRERCDAAQVNVHWKSLPTMGITEPQLSTSERPSEAL
jgi:hypothetical protein